MSDAMKAPGVALGLIVVLVGAVACSSGIRPEVLQGWVGRPATALESAWGPATREVPDGDLRILVYEEVERKSNRSFENTPSGGRASRDPYVGAAAAAQEAYRVPTVYVRSYLFWVNRDGTIVNSMVRQP